MGFSKQEYWSGLPLPSPGDLPDPGISPGSSVLQANSLPSEPPRKTEKPGRQYKWSIMCQKNSIFIYHFLYSQVFSILLLYKQNRHKIRIGSCCSAVVFFSEELEAGWNITLSKVWAYSIATIITQACLKHQRTVCWWKNTKPLNYPHWPWGKPTHVSETVQLCLFQHNCTQIMTSFPKVRTAPRHCWSVLLVGF